MRRAAIWLVAAGCTAGTSSLVTRAPACEIPAQPYRLATLTACVTHLAADDTDLFWLDGSHVLRFPKCGSFDPPKTIGDALGAYDLAVDEHAVYLPRYDGVQRMAKDGSGTTRIAELQSPEQVWVQDGVVYATTEGTCIVGQPCGTDQLPLLWSVPAGGGNANALFTWTGGQIFDVVGSGRELFFTGNLIGVPTVLDRIPTSGGSATSLLPDGSGASGSMLALDDGYVYFLGAPQGLVRVPRAGGTVESVAPDATGSAFATDGAYVYYTTGAGALVRRPAGGGAATTLAPDSAPSNIVVDGGAIYYTTCNRGVEGAIWITAR